jgi:hypothetical protein
MTDKQRRMTNDVMSRIIDNLPPSKAKDDAAKALEKLPGVSITGNVEQLAITLSGPINFSAPRRAERRP